jgi:hypothetical protein
MAKQTRDGEIPHSQFEFVVKKSIVGYFISARVLKKVSAKK